MYLKFRNTEDLNDLGIPLNRTKLFQSFFILCVSMKK